MSSNCFVLDCGDTNDRLVNVGPQRIKSIITSSQQRNDNLCHNLEIKLVENPELTISCHKTYVSTYTSKEHIKRMLTKRGISDEGSSFCTPPRVPRRSEISEFEFKKHCFFRGEICKPKDSKNPTRWRKVIQVKTVGAPGKVPLKNAILQKCEERNDEVSQVVHVRLSSISDLHAANAQ